MIKDKQIAKVAGGREDLVGKVNPASISGNELHFRRPDARRIGQALLKILEV